MLASFLAIINSENVTQIDNLPDCPSPVVSDKKRDRKLFVYKTLHINSKSVRGAMKTENLGVRGSSEKGVRVHLRRGHLRRLPGKVVWVQPIVVGNPKNGIVSKDYCVE